jgi:hypothetical protein
MDWFALGTLAVGFLFGYTTKALKKRRNLLTAEEHRKAVANQALKPRCLCDHWYNAHEVGGGKCMAIVEPDDEWDWDSDYGRLKKKEKRQNQCACQGYIGPDPLASALWMNESLVPNKVRPPV